MHTVLLDALETLEADWKLLQSTADGEDFALQLLSFLTLTRRNSTLSHILNELKDEESRSIRAYDEAEAKVRTEIARLKEQIPSGGVPADSTKSEIFEDLPAREQMSILVQRDAESTKPGTGPRMDSDASEALRLLDGLISGEKLSDSLSSAVHELRLDLQHAQRMRRLERKRSGGAALARLENLEFVLKPDRAIFRDQKERTRWVREARAPGIGGIYSLLHGSGPRETRLDNVLVDIRRDAETLYGELRRRVFGKRSLRLPLWRFKERAEWYDADRLRKIYADNRSSGEDALSAQLALYLHDMGLRPFLRPMMGRLVPDLVNFDQWHLYAECKIFKGRSYILRGVYQAWDTIGRIRTEGFALREAFLIIFRLQGPRLIVPSEVEVDGVVMFPIVVDIASNDVSGSNQKKGPVAINQVDMLPRDSAVYPPDEHDSWWTESPAPVT